MRRSLLSLLAVVLGYCYAPLAVAGDEEALRLAREVTTNGAQLISASDAEGIAATYAEDGSLTVVTRRDGRLVSTDYDGRAAIQTFYGNLMRTFRTPPAPSNTVEYAHFVAADVLAIAGTFVLDQGAERPLEVPYYQVRVASGGAWLIQSMRVLVIPPAAG